MDERSNGVLECWSVGKPFCAVLQGLGICFCAGGVR